MPGSPQERYSNDEPRASFMEHVAIKVEERAATGSLKNVEGEKPLEYEQGMWSEGATGQRSWPQAAQTNALVKGNPKGKAQGKGKVGCKGKVG